MQVRLLGGPEHGRTQELPSDQFDLTVANISDGSHVRYTLMASAAVSHRPLSEAYFVLDSLAPEERERLFRAAISDG